MRFAITLAVVILMGFTTEASAQVPARPPADTLFRPEAIRRMIRVIKAYNTQIQYKDLSDCPSVERCRSVDWAPSVLIDMRWSWGWCEYRNLTAREIREMFTLRLRNYPELRQEAARYLNRNVGRDGFGLYLDPMLANDHGAGDADGERAYQAFIQHLAKYRLDDCTWPPRS